MGPDSEKKKLPVKKSIPDEKKKLLTIFRTVYDYAVSIMMSLLSKELDRTMNGFTHTKSRQIDACHCCNQETTLV